MSRNFKVKAEQIDNTFKTENFCIEALSWYVRCWKHSSELENVQKQVVRWNNDANNNNRNLYRAFPKVSHLKGGLQKVEKAVYRNQSSLPKKHNKNYIQSVLFSYFIFLNNIEEQSTPNLETKNEERNEKRLQKNTTKKISDGV